MEYTTFNLNDYIKVRINQKGYEYLYNQDRKLFINYPNVKIQTAEDRELNADNYGYTQMQMHVFMDRFGSLGLCLPDYIDINILVSKRLV